MKNDKTSRGTRSRSLLALLLAAQLGGFSAFGAEASVVKVKSASQKEVMSKPQTGAVKTEEEDLGLGDPFKYSDGLGGDLSPLTSNKQVGAIEIKGIIHVQGDKPRAILSLKDTKRLYYVSKGDVIRVSAKTRQAALPMEAYIVVKDVREEEVELIQQERPDKVIIIR